jgi:hypothetical protein
MVSVNFYGKAKGSYNVYILNVSRVPCVGERIVISGATMVITQVEHMAITESASVVALCHFEYA